MVYRRRTGGGEGRRGNETRDEKRRDHPERTGENRRLRDDRDEPASFLPLF
jgi:hypothetical protein